LNKYSHIVGTPKWAKLDREREDDSENSDDEILKVSLLLIRIMKEKGFF